MYGLQWLLHGLNRLRHCIVMLHSLTHPNLMLQSPACSRSLPTLFHSILRRCTLFELGLPALVHGFLYRYALSFLGIVCLVLGPEMIQAGLTAVLVPTWAVLVPTWAVLVPTWAVSKCCILLSAKEIQHKSDDTGCSQMLHSFQEAVAQSDTFSIKSCIPTPPSVSSTGSPTKQPC